MVAVGRWRWQLRVPRLLSWICPSRQLPSLLPLAEADITLLTGSS